MVINHGTFTQYTPVAPADPAPGSAAARLIERMTITKLFARRPDGVDWYEFVHSLPEGFYGLVVGGTVISASTDPTAFGVHPAATLIQATGAITTGWTWDGQTLRPPEPAPLSGGDVDRERDRRMTVFTFQGRAFDYDAKSQENIDGAFVVAQSAVLAGKEGLRWFSPSYDFAWIAADNGLVPMDAKTVMEFGLAAKSWKSAHIFKARALKNLTPIPPNYTDNQWWPT